jgi:predicted metal-binding protein
MATEHQIFICTSCRAKGDIYRPGADLITGLRAALKADTNLCSDDFGISGVDCMAGCDSPCTVGFQATGKASYLFGNIELNADIAAVVSFAALYHSLPDGWCSGKLYPRKLRLNTLARVPAMSAKPAALAEEML